MAFWQKLRGLFDSSAIQSAGGLLASITQTQTSPRRGSRELLDAYRTHPWVHAVIHRISSEIGAARFEAFASPTGKRKRAIAVRRGSPPVGSEKLDTHPMLDLLDAPCPAMSRGVWLWLVQAYLDLKGESFLVVERAGDGAPVQLWPVPPHWCLELPNAKTKSYRFSQGTWQRTIPEDDVLWLRHPDLVNPYSRGVGFGESLVDEIDIDEFATKHLRSWFFNRALPEAFITVEGIRSETEARLYEEKLRSKHRGPDKQFQIHVANGKVDVQQLGYNFKDQLLTEIRKQERDTILQVWGVPPEIMGIIENSNRSTIDASRYLFSIGVLCPRVDFLCDAFTGFARREWKDSVTIGATSLVPDDDDFKLKVMTAQPMLFAKNEWRALADAAPVAGWDEQYPEPAALPSFGAPPAPPVEPTKALAAVTRISSADIERVARALKAETLLRQTEGKMQSYLEDWGLKQLRSLGSDASFTLKNPLVQDFMQAFSEVDIVGANQTTQNDIRAALEQGVAEGAGIGDLTRRIKGVFDGASTYRAERIARTEVVGGANAANLAAYQISGLVAGKEWLSVQDGAVREDHAGLDGTRIAIGEDFITYSGDHAQGPGLFGVAEQDINCRCTLLPVLDDKAFDRVGEWKAFDANLIPWENSIRDGLRVAFQTQLTQALQALGSTE